MPRVHQQELDKMYLLAAQKGYSDQEIASPLKTFHSKRGTMYKAKAEKYPPNLKSLEEIVIENEWTKCANGIDRFLIKDIQEIDPVTKKMIRIIIFVTIQKED